MGHKLTPKVILEGTRLTGKTDIAFALNEHSRMVGPKKYRYHSPLVSAEWCAFTNWPWGRGLIHYLAPFIEEQAAFREALDRSILPVHVLDVTDATTEQCADRVVDWLEATGGLWMES